MINGAACTFFALLLVLFTVHPAGASSFASLNTFGFPLSSGLAGSGSPYTTTTSGNTFSGLSGLSSGDGYLSANVASVSPSNQYSGFFGTGSGGLFSGTSFGYPTASHDASSLTYADSRAYEATLGDDQVSFPDLGVNLGSLSSSFPTIGSATSDVKFAENVQLQLTTESDTMPLSFSGFGFPSSFYSF